MSFKYYNAESESLSQTRAQSEVGLQELTIQKHTAHGPHKPEKSVKLIGVLHHLPGGILLSLQNKQGMQIISES